MSEEIFTTHYIKKSSNGDVSMHGKPYADYPKWAYDCLVSQIGIPRNTWQPIETAPKNCTDILIYSDGYVYKSYFIDGYWKISDCDFTAGVIIPTHWMPIPEPPK